MAEQITTMVVKLHPQCSCSKCYEKVKKVLCKFPEIRDQEYDEKQNTVTIKVVSCCPDRIKKKIFCKGGRSIKSIEIKPPTPPPTPPRQTINIHVSTELVFGFCYRECCEGHGGGQCRQLGCCRPPCCDGYCGRPVYDSCGGGGCTTM